MKSITSLVLALFVFASGARAATPILRVAVVGTVTIEVAAEGGGTKKETSVLDNERLFREFGLSKEDYVLVYNNEKMQFFPKRGQLEPVVVFTSPEGHQLTNTAAQSGRVMGPVSSPQATGLFKDFAGTFFGKVTFGAGNESRSIDVVGVGTNAAPTGEATSAHLRFKMVTTGQFVP